MANKKNKEELLSLSRAVTDREVPLLLAARLVGKAREGEGRIEGQTNLRCSQVSDGINKYGD